MKKSERFFCVFCLTVLSLFLCTIALRMFTRKVLVKRLGIINRFTDIVLFDAPDLNKNETIEAQEAGDNEESVHTVQSTVDWAALYPFSEEVLAQKEKEKVEETHDAEESIAGPYDKLISTVKHLEEDLAGYASNHLAGYQAIVEWANTYERTLQWIFVSYSEYNGIIEITDGYLTSIKNENDVKPLSDAVVALKEYCADLGIPLLYVNAPKKVCKEDTHISGVIDFANQNADNLLSLLDAAGVDYYDLRIALHDEGLDHHSLFFRTDHHWKPETGLWAAGKIASLLNREYGFSFDESCVQPDQFSYVIYPQWFLGSQGKKVTLANADPEDITLIYPKYSTDLHYQILDLGIDSDGDFSIMYDMDRVNKRDYYRKNPYSAYIHGSLPLERIENRLIDNESKLLIILDSFGNCVVPFLAMGVRYTDSIDLRYFNGSLQSFIQKEHPDMVIIQYIPDVLSGSMESNSFFDFR